LKGEADEVAAIGDIPVFWIDGVRCHKVRW
jgi:hypothetical protein